MNKNGDEHITRELGTKYGRQYFAVLRAEPEFSDPDEWAVTVYFKEGDSGTNVVRIDTYHGGIHVDQLFDPGEPKDYSIGVNTVWEAAALLEANWEQYAERYRENRE
jgi:hypothetical protein